MAEACVDSLYSLWLPGLIAAVGYVSKLLLEALRDRHTRRQNALQARLSQFCHPVLTRLQENAAIWKLLFSEEIHRLPKGTQVASAIEAQLVKNHEEIMEIIGASRHLMPYDPELEEQIQAYLRHVGLYKALIHAGEKTLPGLVGAPYPTRFDELVALRAEQVQRALQ